MPESLRAAFLALVMGVALTGGIVKCAACTSRSGDLQSVRSALDVGGVALASAYDLAVKSCLELERIEIAAERDGQQTSAETDASMLRIRQDCDRARAGFDVLRTLHGEAAAAYERGDVAEALARLEQIKQQWVGLDDVANASAGAGADGGAR